MCGTRIESSNYRNLVRLDPKSMERISGRRSCASKLQLQQSTNNICMYSASIRSPFARHSLAIRSPFARHSLAIRSPFARHSLPLAPIRLPFACYSLSNHFKVFICLELRSFSTIRSTSKTFLLRTDQACSCSVLIMVDLPLKWYVIVASIRSDHF